MFATKSYKIGGIISVLITTLIALLYMNNYLNNWSAIFTLSTDVKSSYRSRAAGNIDTYGNGTTRTVYDYNITFAYRRVTTSTMVKDALAHAAQSTDCQSCVYIAGSGHMINSKCGKEIDAYDCVFRPNDSPTAGFEADVGEKTTFRTGDRHALSVLRSRLKSGKPFQKSNNFTFVIYAPYKPNLKKAFVIAKELKMSYPGMTFVAMNDETTDYILGVFKKEIDNNTAGIWLTNGFYSLLYMGKVCASITVYGMSNGIYCMEKDAKKVQYHYYDRGGTECSMFNSHSKAKIYAHRYLKEKRVLNKWKRKWKNLTFRNPTWPDS